MPYTSLVTYPKSDFIKTTYKDLPDNKSYVRQDFYLGGLLVFSLETWNAPGESNKFIPEFAKITDYLDRCKIETEEFVTLKPPADDHVPTTPWGSVTTKGTPVSPTRPARPASANVSSNS